MISVNFYIIVWFSFLFSLFFFLFLYTELHVYTRKLLHSNCYEVDQRRTDSRMLEPDYGGLNIIIFMLFFIRFRLSLNRKRIFPYYYKTFLNCFFFFGKLFFGLVLQFFESRNFLGKMYRSCLVTWRNHVIGHVSHQQEKDFHNKDFAIPKFTNVLVAEILF